MEKKTIYLILGIATLGALFLLNKKATASPVKSPASPLETTADPVLFQDSKPKYPIGNVLSSSQTGLVPTGQKIQLKDGDVVKGVPLTAYILRNGKKHPVTEKWWIYNFGDDYSSIIQLSDANVDVIPTGEVLDI